MHLRPGSKCLIRDLNTNLVLDTLRRVGPCARGEIVERARLGRSTVHEILVALEREGLLAGSGRAGSTGGRRAELLRLAPMARLSAGFAVVGPHLMGVLLDLYGLPVARWAAPLTQGLTPLQLARMVGSGVAALTSQVPVVPLTGVGVALPGVVDAEAGMVVNSYTLGWSDIPLRLLLEEQLAVPIVVANDAQSLALAERQHGARPGASTLVAVLISAGVGAGIIAGGALYRGASAAVGELGHVPVRTGGARRCSCGRRGCLQTVASEAAVLQAARLPPDWTQGRLPDTPQVHEALAQAGQALGTALSCLVNLLNPGLIAIAGRLPEAAGALLLEPLRAALRSHALPVIGASTQVLLSRLGPDACAIGAATAVLEAFFQPPIYEPERSNAP